MANPEWDNYTPLSPLLTPEVLAQVPEVDKKFIQYRNVLYGTHSWQMGLDAAGDELVSAIRDATLAAHRQSLLVMTPDEVVEAAKDAVHAAGAWCGVCAYGEPTGEFPGETVGPCADCMAVCRTYVRAALPVLLAPEVAKREQAAREEEREKWRELVRRCSVAIINGELRVAANEEKMDRLACDLIATLKEAR